jgi:hypothetical protein
LDGCGVCGGDGSTCCEGASFKDNCGTCVGEGTGLTACVPDCFGVWGGEAVIDECGICAGGITGLTISLSDTTFTDQDTLIFFTGAYDECGNCEGTCSADEDGFVTCEKDERYIADCAGVCEGIEGSLVNICIGVEGVTSKSECEDEGGYWSEDGIDECNECGGDGSSCLSLYYGLIPDEFSIQNIYPNPFNPHTNIIYAVPENNRVKVAIYDLNGRQITILRDEFHTPGYYSIKWDASQYSSGVYFVDFSSGNFRQTRQVLHIK